MKSRQKWKGEESMARFSLEEGNAERRKRSRVGRREEEACSKRGEDSELGEGDDQERTGIDENEVGREGAEDEAICHERGESSGDAGVCVRIDPDVLDCTICFEPLQPPIFQCQNGHVACPSCCTKLSDKCHMCSQTIRHSRCITLEKIQVKERRGAEDGWDVCGAALWKEIIRYSYFRTCKHLETTIV